MLNFVGYTLFSSLEYFGLFLLIFCSFSHRLEHYKKELIWLTLGFTLFSYILVISNLYAIVPIPLFLVIVLTIVFKRIFGMKYAYCLLISIAGLLFYGLLQAALINVAIYYDVLTFDDTLNAFGIKAYMFQLLCAIISTTTALRIRHYHSGFGFSLRKMGNYFFVITSTLLLILSAVIYLMSLYKQTTNVFIVSAIIFISSTIIIIYLSRKQDDKEFTL